MFKTTTTSTLLEPCFLSAYLEVSVSNLIKNTVRLVNTDTEIVLATAGVLNKFKVDKLFENGVLTVIGEVQTVKK